MKGQHTSFNERNIFVTVAHTASYTSAAFQNLFNFIFALLQFSYPIFFGSKHSSKSTRSAWPTVSSFFGRSGNVLTRLSLDICTIGNNLYSAPWVSKRTAWSPKISRTRKGPCHRWARFLTYTSFTRSSYSHARVPGRISWSTNPSLCTYTHA